MLSADLYARISADDAKQGLGVARQEKDVRAYAQRQKWKVGAVLVDNDVSASRYSRRPRPAYQELLVRLRSGAADRVVVWNLDRLLRQPKELEDLIDLAEHRPIEVHHVNGDVNLRTGDGRFIARILVAKAAKESDDTSQRLCRKKLELAERGLPAGGGLRPYGFEAGGLIVIEAEAGVIRECAVRLLSGDGCKAIARWLEAEGTATVVGRGRWTDGRVRQMLRNPRIAGLRVHRGVVVGPASWPPIVDRATWEALQLRLRNGHVRPGPSPWKYLLVRLLRCSRCGGRLYGAPVHGKARYRCLKQPGMGNCGGLMIAAAPVDDLVVGWALERLSSPVLARHMNDRPPEDDGGVAKIVELEARLEGIALEVARGGIPAREWSTARRSVEEQLQAVRSRVARRAERAVIDGFVASGENLRSLWDGMSLGRRQALLAALIDRIVVHPAQRRGSTTVNLDRVHVVWRV